MELTKQQQRERDMFDLGFDRLTKLDMASREKGYATSSPTIRAIAWDSIQRFARVIKNYHASMARTTDRRKIDECAVRMMELYQELPALSGTTNDEDEVDSLNPHVQPDFTYLVIASTVWKTLIDKALQPGGGIRNLVTSDVGEMLALQYRVLFYTEQEKQLRSKEKIDVANHLKHLQDLVQDSGANLHHRRGRAIGLYDELESGEVVVKRGSKAGTTLIIPKVLKWQDLEIGEFKQWIESCGELFTSLFVVPKGEPSEADDIRPFQYHKGDKRSGDLIAVRPEFHQLLEQVADQIGKNVHLLTPLIVEPEPWNPAVVGIHNKSGGYHLAETKHLTPLVRTDGGYCGTKPSHTAVELVNTLQSVPWRIDQKQFEMVKRIALEWQSDYDSILRPTSYTTVDIKNAEGAAAVIAEVQYREQYKEQYSVVLNKLKMGLSISEVEREFKIQYEANFVKLRELYRAAATSRSSCSAVATMLGFIEAHMKKEEQFFFAWNMDHRGRCYPIASQGHPQGRACERYTLEFARGERLSPAGEVAALRAIGTAALDSKVSIDTRIQWAKDNMELIRELSEGSDRSLTLAKKYEEPLNLISLSRAWMLHENGESWHKPVFADASQSGWAIVAGLMNDVGALRSTNCLAASTADQPMDAYKIAMAAAVKMLDTDNCDVTIKPKVSGTKQEARHLNADERKLLIELITDTEQNVSKLGRSLSKAYARTKIYGSGQITQGDDIEAELRKVGKQADISPELRASLVTTINRAYAQQLGGPLIYNKAIRKAAEERLFQGVDTDIQLAWRMLNADRKKEELQGKQMESFIKLCQLIKQQSKGLVVRTHDGGVVDFAQYLVSTVRVRTVFHGQPTILTRHTDAWDVASMFSCVAPGLIHNLDAAILQVYAGWNQDFTCIHDSVGCHPNHFDEMCHKYREGFLKVTDSDLFTEIAKQWGVELTVSPGKNTSWRDQVMDAVYLFQ